MRKSLQICNGVRKSLPRSRRMPKGYAKRCLERGKQISNGAGISNGVRLRHFGIVVSDLERALHFYRDMLGLKIVKKKYETGDYIDNILDLKNVRVTTVKMSARNGCLIELLYFHSHPQGSAGRKKIYKAGSSHLAFTVESVDKEFKRLSNADVKFNSMPQLSPDGYAKVAFCRDYDGHLVELVEVL